MLVLKRHRSELIHIGGGSERGGVTICVVEVRDSFCRLGITAPPEVTIHRGEVQAMIDAERARRLDDTGILDEEEPNV